MTAGTDGERVAASLQARLDRLTFVDRGADEVTALLIDTVAAWAAGCGWRVYRRAASVLPLPAPYAHRHSYLDVACARPTGAPVVIEVDRVDRPRSVDKLLAEATAGRVAILLRWGTGRLGTPPPPVWSVTCRVTARRGPAGGGRLHSRLPQSERPPPAHTDGAVGVERQRGLFPDHPAG